MIPVTIEGTRLTSRDERYWIAESMVCGEHRRMDSLIASISSGDKFCVATMVLMV